MQSKFTSVPRRHCGAPRFPDESHGPANGPVVTYRLTPEEIAARYGAPVEPQTRRKKLSRENLAEWLRKWTVGQVAEMNGIPQKLVFSLCEQFGLELDDKNRLINKEAIDLPSVMDNARSILPAETLGALLTSGKTGTEIGKEYNLPPWAVSKLKNEYWPEGVGFNQDDYRQQVNENRNTGNKLPENDNDLGDIVTEMVHAANEAAEEPDATVQSEVLGERTPASVVSVRQSFDFSAFKWVVPHRFGSTRMVLKIKRENIVLTAAAAKALSPARFIKIGVDSTGTLAIVPAASVAEGYKLPGNKYYSNLGGGNLVRFLLKHGYGPGEYELESVNGCLVATRR